MAGLILTAVMFGITVGVLSFLTRRWREEELERRRRRALLASGARRDDDEEDEDGNPPKPKAEAEKPEQVILAYTEEESVEVVATLERLIREMITALQTYQNSYNAVATAVSLCDSAVYENNKIEDFPEFAVLLDTLVAKRLEHERNVLARQHEVVQKVGEILSPKDAQAAIAALQKELKRVTPFKVSQLPARLAAVRMVAKDAAVAGENLLKTYMGDEQKVRKRVATARSKPLKVSAVADSDKSEALYKRLNGAYVEFRKKLKTLTDAACQCCSVEHEVTRAACDTTTLKTYPSVATIEELARVLTTAENRIQAHRNAQARAQAAIKETPGLLAPFDAALAAWKAIVQEVDKIEAPQPQKIVVVRKLFADWSKTIDEKSTEARSSVVKYANKAATNVVAEGTLTAPDTEPVKAIMLACLTIIFRFTEVYRTCYGHAYSHKRVLGERGFRCPEKPNDVDIGVLTKALEDWAVRMAASSHDYFGSYQVAHAMSADLKAAFVRLQTAMQPLLGDMESYEPKSYSQAAALKLMFHWIRSKQDEEIAELGKLEHTSSLRARPEVKTRDADQGQVALLKSSMRSMAFALAQGHSAMTKYAGIIARSAPCEPAMPGYIPQDGAPVDFDDVIAQIEAHHAKCAEVREQQRAHKEEEQAALEAANTRYAKTTERRVALNSLASATRTALSDETSDELYLTCLMAEKLATLFA